MKKVMLLVGAGQIGMAIARRIGTGMKIIVGDKKTENTENIAAILNNAGFDAFPVETDLSDRASIQSMIAKGAGIRGDYHACKCGRCFAQPSTH